MDGDGFSENANTDDWSNDIEDLCRNISSNATVFADHHKQSYIALQGQLIWFKMPLIILSGCNSVFSVGLQSWVEQPIVSTINCIISLICATITSAELYLGISKRSEQELISFRDFYLLGVKINACLDLKPQHRSPNGKEFLQLVLSEYTSLFEASNVDKLEMQDKIVPLINLNPMYGKGLPRLTGLFAPSPRNNQAVCR